MLLGVKGTPTGVPTAVDPDVMGNMTLVQLKLVPHPVVAAQAVAVGGFVCKTSATMTPKAGWPLARVGRSLR